MDLLAKIAAEQVVETKVKFKHGKDTLGVRLRPPSHEDALRWGEESAEIDRRFADGEINDATRQYLGAMGCLRYTLVVDPPLAEGEQPPPDYQPELSDDQVATLLRISGGVLKVEGKDGGELAREARDIMWASNAFDAEKLEEVLAKAEEKTELPLESPDGTD